MSHSKMAALFLTTAGSTYKKGESKMGAFFSIEAEVKVSDDTRELLEMLDNMNYRGFTVPNELYHDLGELLGTDDTQAMDEIASISNDGSVFVYLLNIGGPSDLVDFRIDLDLIPENAEALYIRVSI